VNLHSSYPYKSATLLIDFCLTLKNHSCRLALLLRREVELDAFSLLFCRRYSFFRFFRRSFFRLFFPILLFEHVACFIHDRVVLERITTSRRLPLSHRWGLALGATHVLRVVDICLGKLHHLLSTYFTGLSLSALFLWNIGRAFLELEGTFFTSTFGSTTSILTFSVSSLCLSATTIDVATASERYEVYLSLD